MAKTKKELQLRHQEILVELDKIEEKAQRENRALTEEETQNYDALMREDERLHIEMRGMLDERELAKFNEQKDKNAQLREFLQGCVKNRSNASTVLMNAVTAGADQNTVANLEASGAIPVTINEIIDTKVPGIELPEDAKVVTGVVGNEIWPLATNDVQFTVEGEVSKVAEQALTFDNLKAVPARVAASVAVSHRAIDNAAFDLLSFITYKMRKGWAIFIARHLYAHGAYTKLQSAFAKVDIVDINLDENIGKNIAKAVAAMYDKGFEGVPVITMDKVMATELEFTKRIPGQTGDRTVVENGQCVGYPMTISPFIDYSISAQGVATKDDYHYIGIGHFGYMAIQQHGEMRFNVDAQSSANFDRGTVVIGMSTDFSLTELSNKVNGNANGKPQAFTLLRVKKNGSTF